MDLQLEDIGLVQKLISELDISVVSIPKLEGVYWALLIVLPTSVMGDKSFGSELLVHS